MRQLNRYITGIEDAAGSAHLQLLTVEIVNRTTVRLGLTGDLQSRHQNITVESSLDQKTWKRQDAKGLLVQGLEPGRSYYIRVKGGDMVSNAVEVTLPINGTQRPGTGSYLSCLGRNLTRSEISLESRIW